MQKKFLIKNGIVIAMIGACMLCSGCRNEDYKSLEVKNDRTYKVTDAIKKEDFSVYGIDKDGKKNKLKADDYKISTDKVSPIGNTTEVVVRLKNDHKVSKIFEVKNERKKVESFEVGSPNKKDVKAVVYSNGELAFEGKGSVMLYDHGKYPWQNTKNKIEAISFESTVKPYTTDFWFENMKSIKNAGKLPASVTSANGMFKGCENLIEAADWSECSELADISSMYYGCKKLEKCPLIVPSVRMATFAFANCDSLKKTPRLKEAHNLTNAIGMFAECKNLKETDTAPNIEVMDMMYKGCVKLENMPTISKKTISMNETFNQCESLKKTTTIPKNVQYLSGCFFNCKNLEDEIVIHSNAKHYEGFLSGVTPKGKLYLKGDSKILKELAKTSGSKRIVFDKKYKK